jgi:hypothetical protein
MEDMGMEIREVTEYDHKVRIVRIHMRKAGYARNGSELPRITLCNETLNYCQNANPLEKGGYVNGSPFFSYYDGQMPSHRDCKAAGFDITICQVCQDAKPKSENDPWEDEFDGLNHNLECRRGCGREVEYEGDMCDRCYEEENPPEEDER